ncbi:MAG: copper amine oxidase, partial [Paenibacillus sp.]|nr:copper amine oxidase [Paenibacillus sp.]
MRRRLTLRQHALLWSGLSGVILIGLIIALLPDRTSAPASPSLPAHITEPATPELLGVWRGQLAKAELAGQAEVAAAYQERITAFQSGWPTLTPLSPEWSTAPSVPQSTFEIYTRSNNKQAHAASNSTPQPMTNSLAKHEPASGVYLGMLGADRRVGYDVNKIETVYGRKHAIYMAYVGWRKVQTDTNTYFPARTAERVKALDGALQIGWEPRYGLDDVLDDEYVRRFAREAKASGIPIFLRYASEMNGSWVLWHGEPQKYIEKFRLIHDIMEEEAPNVAMVWSPNFWPPDNMHEYYPGDDYVDWVGFSLYTSPYQDGKEFLKGSLIDTLAPIYDTYSHKPIMISEGAIAHTHLPSNTAYLRWAEGQLAYMYGLLPRLFPQVKAITYFNFSLAQARRTNSEFVYDLGENPYMDAMYQRLVASDWYLSSVEKGIDPIPYQYAKLSDRSLPAGKQTVIVYPKLENEKGITPFAVVLYQGKQRLGISYEAPWEMDITVDPTSAQQPWYAVAYDSKLMPIS